jgi:hypothetical protein
MAAEEADGQFSQEGIAKVPNISAEDVERPCGDP